MFGPQTVIRLRILLKEPAIEAFRGGESFQFNIIYHGSEDQAAYKNCLDKIFCDKVKGQPRIVCTRKQLFIFIYNYIYYL